jgi:hypothetical protein
MIYQKPEQKDDADTENWLVLDALLGSHLLRELPAYKNASYKYCDLAGILPELRGKTQG